MFAQSGLHLPNDTISGVGIGLTSAFALVTALGGSIKISSSKKSKNESNFISIVTFKVLVTDVNGKSDYQKDIARKATLHKSKDWNNDSRY